MRPGLLALLLLGASAVRAEDRLGLELDTSVGLGAPLAAICFDLGCPGAPVFSLRAGYALGRSGSLGLRAEAAPGPRGASICFTSCTDSGGYQSAAVLLDAMAHTLGDTQFVAAAALGIGRLIRLQCACETLYDTHGSRLPVLELALGLRTYSFLPAGLHAGLEARYAVMFGAESAGYAPAGQPAEPTIHRRVESLALSLVLGASL
jgi:hypothetical protein